MDNQFFTAWCWMLLHSLWIGGVVAALTGLLISIAARAPARLRYNLLCAMVLLFVGACAFTFWYQLGNIKANAASVRFSVPTGTGGSATVKNYSGYQWSYRPFVALLNRFSTELFALWTVCFAFKAIQLSRAMFDVWRVRTSGIDVNASAWDEKLVAFSRQLGINRQVKLLASQLVKVPVTVGYFKPVILFPAGMFLQLTPGQIESIIYHELGHILRRDYLVNILQSVIETIFFFNPAVLWLSALIREERENCCDDLVLSRVPQKRNYLEALLAFQTALQGQAYAMGLSHRPDQLMKRLKRMLGQENQKLNSKEKTILFLGMLMLAMFTLIPSANSAIQHTALKLKRQVASVWHKKSVSGADITIKHTPQKSQPKVHPLTAQSVSIDTALHFTSIKFNKTNADTANKEMYVMDDRGTHYHLIVTNSQLANLDINDVAVPTAQLNNYNGLLLQVNTALAKARRYKAEKMVQSMHKQLAQPATTGSKHQRPASDQTVAVIAKKKDFKQKQLLTDQSAADSSFKKVGKLKRPTTDQVADAPPVKRRHPAVINIDTDRTRVQGVLAALVQEGVVKNTDAVDWFGLSDTELIVNGQAQPEALQQKLKANYGVKAGFGLYYGPVKMTGVGVFMEKKDL